eukprot:TRINITY_DN29396_c0_g1_i1.p1 TRINITY_DN29396_c0_g1~~TRINITY_DN29396_c0_g1_i1.p1  ORF type:complete len:634 (+),score=97.08 TRINITY_DN29396_c0_g1_i1:82-1983(+)
MPIKGKPDHLYLGQAVKLGSPPPSGAETGAFPIKSAICKAAEQRFDFVVLPLAAPGGQGSGVDFVPSVDSALALDGRTWNAAVVGSVSDSLGVSLKTAPSVAPAPLAGWTERRNQLETELRWAAHLSLRNCLLPTPAKNEVGSYARTLSEMILSGVFETEDEGLTLSVRVPPTTEGWKLWNQVRTLCDHSVKLAVALDFTADVSSSSERELERWCGEPVRYTLLNTACFIPNKSGYPVLPKNLKFLLTKLFERKVQCVLEWGDEEDISEEAESTAKRNTANRLSYIARLFQSRPPPTEAEMFAASHLDTLQAPLQPLADHLESNVYELFETDPVKYVQYENATHAFYKDRVAAGKEQPFRVMVLGAGRGPLVAAALKAAKKADVSVTVWAVEKNPNAVHALRHRRRSEPDWKCVEVVASDMRAWKPTHKADCVISELLGSWGDNELSPECLDGAQHLLAEDGVSIPGRYVSSLTPASCSKAWDRAREGGELKNLESSYVVQLHQAFYPCADIKDCFVFEHPNKELSSNERYMELDFEVEVDALIHGFAGYFDCDLYGGHRISIHPKTFSDGMFSWFPIYFTLRTPVYVRKGDVIRSQWWRRVEAGKVWYEWSMTEPVPTILHNSGGQYQTIGH